MQCGGNYFHCHNLKKSTLLFCTEVVHDYELAVLVKYSLYFMRKDILSIIVTAPGSQGYLHCLCHRSRADKVPRVVSATKQRST